MELHYFMLGMCFEVFLLSIGNNSIPSVFELAPFLIEFHLAFVFFCFFVAKEPDAV